MPIVRVPAPTEAQFTRLVVEYAQLHSWLVFHTRPARTAKGWVTPVQFDGAGFVDLVLVRPGRLVFAELKAEGGRLSPRQLLWLEALKAAGQEVHVWRPSQWDEIVRVLKED